MVTSRDCIHLPGKRKLVCTAISNLSCTSQILVKFPFINLSTIMIQGSCLTYFLCTDYFAKQFSKQLRYDRSTQYSNSVAKYWFQSKDNKLKGKINGLIFLKPHLISKFIERHDTAVFIQIIKSRTKLNNMQHNTYVKPSPSSHQ